MAGLFLTFVTYSGGASAANGETYTLISIAGVRARPRLALRRLRKPDRHDLRRLMFRTIGVLLSRLQLDPLWQPLFQGVVLLVAVNIGSARLFQVRNRRNYSHDGQRPAESSRWAFQRVDRPVVVAFGCIIALLLVGSLYSRSFLSPEYLLQQLKVASFLGVIATGTMIVILLGQIDLSVPWVVAVGGMMSTAATGGDRRERRLRSVGIACGVALGPSTASALPICASPP